jgi:pSer/pThr/pTyr-binding forkhead associated (FHA) protein
MDGLVLKEIPLAKQRTTIGRKAHNDIQIDNMAVSGEHAAIVTILDDAFLEDLDSTNGTLVNGQTVKKHVLRHNDVIDIGKYRLKYMVDDVAAFSRFQDDKEAVPTPPVAPPPAPLPRVSVRLLTGPQAGKALELVKEATTLGKPGVQVAVIARRPGAAVVSHADGGQPPLLNGNPLAAGEQMLADKDVLELAGVRMEIRIAGAA